MAEDDFRFLAGLFKGVGGVTKSQASGGGHLELHAVSTTRQAMWATLALVGTAGPTAAVAIGDTANLTDRVIVTLDDLRDEPEVIEKEGPYGQLMSWAESLSPMELLSVFVVVHETMKSGLEDPEGLSVSLMLLFPLVVVTLAEIRRRRSKRG